MPSLDYFLSLSAVRVFGWVNPSRASQTRVDMQPDLQDDEEDVEADSVTVELSHHEGLSEPPPPT